MSTSIRHSTSLTRHECGLWATLSRRHPAGTVLTRHHHRRGQLVFAIRGVMWVETLSAQWTVPPQRALWVPAGAPHEVRMLTDTHMCTVYCDTPLLDRATTFLRKDQVHAVMASPLVRELVVGLFDLHYSEATRAQMVALLLMCLEHAEDAAMRLPLPGRPDLRSAVGPLLNGARWDLQVSDLADAAGLTERTFTRRFTSEVGMSFRTWKQRARLLSSLDLLAAGGSVKSVAHTLGFAHPAAYTAAFRQLLGSPPGVFRTEEPTSGGMQSAHE